MNNLPDCPKTNHTFSLLIGLPMWCTKRWLCYWYYLIKNILHSRNNIITILWKCNMFVSWESWSKQLPKCTVDYICNSCCHISVMMPDATSQTCEGMSLFLSPMYCIDIFYVVCKSHKMTVPVVIYTGLCCICIKIVKYGKLCFRIVHLKPGQTMWFMTYLFSYAVVCLCYIYSSQCLWRKCIDVLYWGLTSVFLYLKYMFPVALDDTICILECPHLQGYKISLHKIIAWVLTVLPSARHAYIKLYPLIFIMIQASIKMYSLWPQHIYHLIVSTYVMIGRRYLFLS